MRAPVKLFFASSNPGKLKEFRALAGAASRSNEILLELLPQYSSEPPYAEDSPTFAENALGKALHYSRLTEEMVFADDSGLVVPFLGGAPGVHSARYAGERGTGEECNRKLLRELAGASGAQRSAYFCCAIALVRRGQAIAIVTSRADGEILESPQGNGGFGYDPVFYYPPLSKTFAQLSREEKNEHSHRGKAFRRLMAVINSTVE